MENIVLLILGVFISVMGIVNIKGNISTIHSYNRRKVKEEDIPKYGKAVGTGTLIIGVSLVLGFIVSFWSEEMIAYITHPAVVVGLGFMLYGLSPRIPLIISKDFLSISESPFSLRKLCATMLSEKKT